MEWNKEEIREFRKKLSLTQYQFAELLGTSQDIISNWETGKRNPSGPSQKALSLIAGVADVERDIEKIKSKEQKESPLSGDAIRAFREKLSLSQTEFAEKLGRDHSTVSYWESKEISPSKRSRKALKELAEKFSIDLSKLLEETLVGASTPFAFHNHSTSHDVKSEGLNEKDTFRPASPDSHSSASRDGINCAIESIAQEEIDPTIDLTGEQGEGKTSSSNDPKGEPSIDDSNASEETSNFFDSSKDTDTDDTEDCNDSSKWVGKSGFSIPSGGKSVGGDAYSIQADEGVGLSAEGVSKSRGDKRKGLKEEESSKTEYTDTNTSSTSNRGGANFTSSPSVKSGRLTHGFLPEPNIRIVGSGIDRLYLGFYAEVNEKLLNTLEAAKAEASNSSFGEALISIGENTFTIEQHSKDRYRYLLSNGDMGLQVAKGDASSYPNVYVDMKSLYILETSVDSAVNEVRSFVSSNFGSILREKVSRVEMYVDVAGEKVYLQDVDKFVSRASILSFYREHGEFTGFALGKGDIRAKVYNKKAEIKKSHKEYMYSIWDGVSEDEEVWRIEFSLERRALKGWGVEDYDSFKAFSGDIWKYLTEDWLSMRELDNENTTRRSLTELWEEVCSARDFFGKVTGALRNNKRISSIEQYISQMGGLQTSMGAVLYKLGHDVGKQKQRVRKLAAARIDERSAKRRILAKGLAVDDLTSEEIEIFSSQEFEQEVLRKAVNCE